MNLKKAFEGLGTTPGENPWAKIVTPKATEHEYLKSYQTHFDAAIDRKKVKSFCELGVSRGASLIAWKRYFPNAKIIGIDHDIKPLTPEMGPSFWEFSLSLLGDASADITIEIGDAMDTDFLKEVAEKYGGFDIVLDDCSHFGKQMAISFHTLWKHTRFLYIVEDLQTQFAEGIARGHYEFSKSRKYNVDGNFITDYLQDLVTEQILPLNIQNKTEFTPKRKDISKIITENFMASIYRSNR